MEPKHEAAAGLMAANAVKLIIGDRNKNYGDPHEDWARTAKMWSGLCGKEIDAKTAMLMMVQVKLSREMHKHGTDNLIDAIGYILCAYVAELHEQEKAKADNGD
jgi:hypothetical protein